MDEKPTYSNKAEVPARPPPHMAPPPTHTIGGNADGRGGLTPTAATLPASRSPPHSQPAAPSHSQPPPASALPFSRGLLLAMMRVSDPVSAMLIEGWSDSITELTASSALRSLSTRPSGRPNSSELPSGADAYPLWSSQEDQSPGLGQQG